MDAGAEQAGLDSTQLFEVLPRKNNKTREGDKGVEDIWKMWLQLLIMEFQLGKKESEDMKQGDRKF